MHCFKLIFAFIAIVLLSACDKEDDNIIPESDLANTELKVIGKGTVLAQVKSIEDPRTLQTVSSNCFFMELVDAKTGAVIGSLNDCGLAMTPNSDGTIMAEQLPVFSITNMGTFVSENFVLLTPKGNGVFTTSSEPATNNILEGTEAFSDATGTVSLNGEADMSLLDSGIVTFNCEFTIKFN